MPLPASGTISLNDLQTEFGGSNPIAITEYYRGGGLVPDIAANSSVPTSGQISLSNFYNATNADYVPAAFDINNITVSGDDLVQQDSNQITITGINTPITLNFGTTDASVQRTGTGFGTAVITTYVYVNGVQANSVTWSRATNGSNTAITRNMKVTVSNGANVIVGFAVGIGGDTGDGGGTVSATTFTVTNDSSSNTSLDTFTVSGTVSVS